MMCIMVPETCWASNKICNKYHLLHLVGILFPHISNHLLVVLLHGCLVSKYIDWLHTGVASLKIRPLYYNDDVGIVFGESDRDVMDKIGSSKFMVANGELRHHRRLWTTSPINRLKFVHFLYIELLHSVWLEDTASFRSRWLATARFYPRLFKFPPSGNFPPIYTCINFQPLVDNDHAEQNRALPAGCLYYK